MEGLAVVDFPRSPSLGKVSEKTVHECSRIVEGTVMQVSYQADKLDNELSDEFGSKMYWAQQS